MATTLRSWLVRQSSGWHRRIGWLALLAMMVFGISGISHPLMVWTGPKAAAFFPPSTQLQAGAIHSLQQILLQQRIEKAQMVKLIESETGSLLQITQSERQPRRYFDLDNLRELPDYDRQQALWLARYYTGLSDTPVASIHWQTEFDDAYPWVNRLLPVYRVEFATDDHLTAYIYTETNALAGLSNDWKTLLQGLFRALHTWDWLKDVEWARVLIVALLLLCLGAMAVSGIHLVMLFKKRTIQSAGRRWHRRLAWLLWLPLLAFTSSGLYHLLQNAYGDNHRGLQLAVAMDLPLSQWQTNKLAGSPEPWLEPYRALILNHVSLVSGPGAQPLYRLSLAKGKPGMTVTAQQRFDGVPSERGAIYLDALNGAVVDLTDQQMALHIAEQQLGLAPEQLLAAELITHFGLHYDFRNKRLPVWQLDYDSALGDKVFIDPASGVLVDRLVDAERYEGYSFSFLHKWNFLTPVTGRPVRDGVMVVILVSLLALSVLGARLLWLRRRRSHPAAPSAAVSLAE